MNYSSDRPIETEKQDLLGRSRFSNQLGKAIYEYNGEDGLVIGLFGKWGTGKTSIINMAVNSIKEFTTNDTDMPIILRFSPWNYSDKDNLILLFFNSLKSKLEKNNKKLKRKVGKALSDYSVALDAFSLVPMIGNWIPLIKSSAQITGKKLMQNLDLDKTKENLEKVLKELNKKIVIIIDDIDRLTNSQIRDIFQLVKQVADFPNIIYVLAMDRDVVTRALTEKCYNLIHYTTNPLEILSSYQRCTEEDGFYIVMDQPCFGRFYVDDFVSNHLRKGIPDYKEILQAATERFALLQKVSRFYTFFTEAGIKRFMGDGTLDDFPVEIVEPFLPKERSKLVKKLDRRRQVRWKM